MMHVGGLEKRKNVIEVLGVAQTHGFPMLETPQPEGRGNEVVTKEDAFFSSIVMCSIYHMRMLSWQVTCNI